MTQTEREKEKKRLYELIARSYTSNRSKWEVELFEDYMLQDEIPKLVDDLLDGGVIVPPCRVGDVVYWLHVHCTDPSDDDCDGNCYSCGYSSIDIEKWIINSLYRMVIAMESWEQCCFPTREEAEQALKESD